jgi:PAS domain S-box-containing protein
MDLRTKLVFALVLTALGSMFALGGVTYVRARDLVREATLEQIEALAQTRKEAVEKLLSGWDERVSLIASRTQLRESLEAYNQTGDQASADRVELILADALGSVQTVQSLLVRDARGLMVATVGRRPADGAASPVPALPEGSAAVTFHGITFPPDRNPEVSLMSPLMLGGRRIGGLEVVLDGWELRLLVESVEGMGATGQTILAARDPNGTAHVLRPERAGESGLLVPLPTPDAADPVRGALEGDEDRWVDVVDRRGQRIWAATRHLPEVEWGLTVAFDEAEELTPLVAFRKDMADLALSLSAIAILFGTLLGLRFAKPLQDLASVADRIRGGELGARAPVDREDEIGLLATTFNQMTDELERQVVLLREYQRFFDVSIDMMCIAGTDGYFKRVNPAFTSTLGWNQQELLGEPFFALIHPDDVESTEREVAKLSEGLPTVSFRNRFRTVDGGYRELVWASYPDPETGLLYAIARDITDVSTD